jgi:tetratricopeptide (TPR) repeat protein
MKRFLESGWCVGIAGAVVSLLPVTGFAEDFYWLWQTTNPAAAMVRTSAVSSASGAPTELVVRVVEAVRAGGEGGGARDQLQLRAENIDLRKSLERASEEARKAGDAATENAKLQPVVRALEQKVAELTSMLEASAEATNALVKRVAELTEAANASAQEKAWVEAKWFACQKEGRLLVEENALLKEEVGRLRDELTEVLASAVEAWDREDAEAARVAVVRMASQEVARVPAVIAPVSNVQVRVEPKAGVTGGVVAVSAGKAGVPEPVRELSPKEVRDARFQKAQEHVAAGRFKEAEAEYTAILKLDPSDAAVHYAIGVLYEDGLKDWRRAVAHYRRYLLLLPAGPEAEAVRKRIKAAGAR